MFNLQTFDSGAGAEGLWWYLVADGDEGAPVSGWYLYGECDELAEYTFKQGEGFMIYSDYDDESGAGYTIAGAVTKGETKIAVNNAYTLIGNIRPAEVNLQDITPYAPNGEDVADYMFNLQTFDSGAGAAGLWWYLVADGDEGAAESGWYLYGECDELAEYTFKPGEGFMLYSDYDDISDYDEGQSAGVSFKAIID